MYTCIQVCIYLGMYTGWHTWVHVFIDSNIYGTKGFKLQKEKKTPCGHLDGLLMLLKPVPVFRMCPFFQQLKKYCKIKWLFI